MTTDRLFRRWRERRAILRAARALRDRPHFDRMGGPAFRALAAAVDQERR